MQLSKLTFSLYYYKCPIYSPQCRDIMVTPMGAATPVDSTATPAIVITNLVTPVPQATDTNGNIT